MIGQTVSHYRIIEPLGEGGMGSVYLAEDTLLGRRVAIKFPTVRDDEHDYRGRFLREARAISELSHPRIATLFDYGETADGQPFLVMELAKGKPLNDLIRTGPLSLLRAVEIVRDVATALAEAHAGGVIHRDIKPSNIMVDEAYRVKVLDFGLAKQLQDENPLHSEPEARTMARTRSGVVLGTPAYLSPEQAVAGKVDARSDLFALGVVLYEILTGQTPFPGTNLIEIAAKVLHFDPAPPSKLNPRVPPELDFLTLKALAKKPEGRYQSAEELVADLRNVQEILQADSGQTLIKKTSPSAVVATSRTLNNLSAMLVRPRVPIYYVVIGLAVVALGIWLAVRWWRPTPHQPTAEAQHWYEVGSGALREGAYYQASKAFERSIVADDAYMLAHARLAEALVELDYVDRAKDELLRVNSTNQSALSKTDVAYLDAIIATARRDYAKAVSLYNQIAQQANSNEKPYVLVDLGRAYEKNNDLKKAIETYTEASNQNSQYATPLLRLGILYGRQQELTSALASFDKAEAIYAALGSQEGRGEVIFQRGALFNKLNKLTEAKSQLEQALTLAKATNNRSLEIKTLLQLSSASIDMGETSRATEYAKQAVELAQKNGMENLTARGLNDLGNAFMIKGEYGEAEKYLSDAFQSAQRSKALSNEARARVSLANLRLQQNKAEEAVGYLEPALAFYRQGGYESETFSCLALLARANMQKGDYEAGLKIDRQLLQLAQQRNDQSLRATAHTEMGNALVRQEKFSEALDHYSQAYVIYKSQGLQRSIGFNLLARCNSLSELGRYGEGQTLLDEANAIANVAGGGYKNLAIETELAAARMALSQGRFAEAKGKAENVLAAAGGDFPGAVFRSKMIIGLSQSYSGAAAVRDKTVAEATDLAGRLNEPGSLAAAHLALAEAMLLSGDAKTGLSTALRALEVFPRLGQQASEWRALVVAGLASRDLGDKSKAREYALKATESLSKLEQRWGSENYNSYLSRPDVQRFRKQLGRLMTAPS